METFELYKILMDSGFFTAKEATVVSQAATNIAGDHYDLYDQINELVKAKDELTEMRASLASIVLPGTKKERKPRAVKPKVEAPSDQLAADKKKKRGLGKSIGPIIDQNQGPEEPKVDL